MDFVTAKIIVSFTTFWAFVSRLSCVCSQVDVAALLIVLQEVSWVILIILATLRIFGNTCSLIESFSSARSLGPASTSAHLLKLSLLQFNSLFGQVIESLVYVRCFLGRCFEEEHVIIFLAIRLRLRLRHRSRGVQITLIAQYEEWNALRIVCLWFAQEVIFPSDNMVKTLRVRYIIHDAAAVGAAVECWRQALESLLTCRVPYLQDDLVVVVDLHLLVCEICADCWLEIFGKPWMFKLLN